VADSIELPSRKGSFPTFATGFAQQSECKAQKNGPDDGAWHKDADSQEGDLDISLGEFFCVGCEAKNGLPGQW
jgi:hypothetical protein